MVDISHYKCEHLQDYFLKKLISLGHTFKSVAMVPHRGRVKHDAAGLAGSVDYWVNGLPYSADDKPVFFFGEAVFTHEINAGAMSTHQQYYRVTYPAGVTNAWITALREVYTTASGFKREVLSDVLISQIRFYSFAGGTSMLHNVDLDGLLITGK